MVGVCFLLDQVSDAHRGFKLDILWDSAKKSECCVVLSRIGTRWIGCKKLYNTSIASSLAMMACQSGQSAVHDKLL